jgi:hypothetical protein
MRMQVWTRTFMIAGAVLALGATLPVKADEQKPYRIRGTLESVESNKLTVNTREGEAQIAPGSTSAKLTDEGGANMFRVCGRDDRQGTKIGDHLADHWADKKIAASGWSSASRSRVDGASRSPVAQESSGSLPGLAAVIAASSLASRRSTSA